MEALASLPAAVRGKVRGGGGGGSGQPSCSSEGQGERHGVGTKVSVPSPLFNAEYCAVCPSPPSHTPPLIPPSDRAPLTALIPSPMPLLPPPSSPPQAAARSMLKGFAVAKKHQAAAGGNQERLMALVVPEQVPEEGEQAE